MPVHPQLACRCVGGLKVLVLVKSDSVALDSVENTKREDLAFIGFQVWLLGMSLVALLNESIPHVYVSYSIQHSCLSY